MIQAIVYCSNTGFTKQYAYSLAVKTGIPIYNLNEAKCLKDGTNILYFSWLMGNNIVNLKKISRFNVVKYCCVGMSFFSDELIDSIKRINDVSDVYYLRAGLRYYKLNIFYRFMLKIVRKSLKKKDKKKQINTEEKILLETLTNGSEYIDLDSLNILVSYIEEENNQIVC